MAESDAESVSSLDVKRWDAAQKALLAHGEVLMRDAQARDGPAFPPRAFNAMLVGCCGVRRGSHPLARRLAPDVINIIAEFLPPRIAPRASAALNAAAGDFARRIFADASIHALHRGSFCVHAGDVDAVIALSGADRLAGRRRRPKGCSCAGCVASPWSIHSTTLTPDRWARTREPLDAAPAPMSRPSLAWCEAAPVDGSTPQSAIHGALRILALQGCSSILAPGALDAVASAVIGFCNTVLTRARDGDSQLLRDIAAVDRRVDCLRDVCQARYDALRDAGELRAASDRPFDVKKVQPTNHIYVHRFIWSGEGPVDSDSDASDSDASDDFRSDPWLVRDSESEASDDEALERAEVYDGLTDAAVLDALSYLQVSVYCADDRNHRSLDRGVLTTGGVDGVLHVFAEEVQSGDDSDGGGKVVASDDGLDLPATVASDLLCHAFDSRCPDCGRMCLVACIEVTLDGDLVRQRPVTTHEDLETIEKLPHFISPAVELVGGPTHPYEFATISTDELAPLMRAAAREAGVRHVASTGPNRLVGSDDDFDLYKTWMTELVVLAQAARDATEVAPAPIRYVHALQAIIQVLDLSPRRLHPISLQTADLDQTASYDEIVRRTLGVSTPHDVLGGPLNIHIDVEGMPGDQIDHWQGGCGRVEVDDDANELFSRFLSRRLATLFSKALCMPRGVLCPFTGNGATLEDSAVQMARRMNAERC